MPSRWRGLAECGGPRRRRRRAEVVDMLPDGCMDLRLDRRRAARRRSGHRAAPLPTARRGGRPADCGSARAAARTARRAGRRAARPPGAAGRAAPRPGPPRDRDARRRRRTRPGAGRARRRAARRAARPRRPCRAVRLARGAAAADTADALGWTTRTLHRHCLAAFGYGPAVLRRVLRFRRAMALLRAGVGARRGGRPDRVRRPTAPVPRGPRVRGRLAGPRRRGARWPAHSGPSPGRTGPWAGGDGPSRGATARV